MTYTQATNFQSSGQGGVDPRTGSFSYSFILAHLCGNKGRGPSLPITLKYDPMSSYDFGFGVGWNLGWSTYNTDTKVLSLESQDQYIVDDTSGNLVLRDQKIVNILFTYLNDPDGTTSYCIKDKNGGVTLLTGHGEGTTVKVPKTIVSPVGRKILLEWDEQPGIPRLQTIKDEKGIVLMQAAYSDGSAATMTFWPGTKEEVGVALEFSQGQLISLTKDTMVWTLAYDPTINNFNGTPPLYKVTMPTGLVAQVTYTPDGHGHKYPPSASQYTSPLPYVTQYTQTPYGSQPAVETAYTFSSDTNFLGYGCNVDPATITGDYLHHIPYDDSYQYTSKVSVRSGTDQVSTTRTYNMYHLVVTEQQDRAKTRTVVTTSYPITEGALFAGQPVRAQLPSKSVTTYTDLSTQNSRTEPTSYTYDDYGNVVSKITADGTLSEWIYHPAHATPDCPAAPIGVPYCIKRHTLTPASKAASAITFKEHTYLKLPVGGAVLSSAQPVAYTVLVNAVTQYVGKRQVFATRNSYITDKTQDNFGHITTAKHTVKGDDGKAYDSTISYDFAHDDPDNTVTIKTSFLSSLDQSAYRTSDVYSRYTGHHLAKINTLGNKTSYQYDALGRVTQQIDLDGSPQAYHTTYKFTSELSLDEGVYLQTSTCTDRDGAIRKRTYDGFGRIIKTDMVVDGQPQPIIKQDFDGQGRLATVASLSKTTGDSDAASAQIVKALSYDDWGYHYLSTFSGGTHQTGAHPQNLFQYNPVTLDITQQIGAVSNGKTVTKYDPATFLPLQVDYYEDGNATTPKAPVKNTYDDFRRLTTHTDRMGYKTKYEYDVWSRVTKITLANGTIITKTYAAHSTRPLLTGIWVNGKSLGTKTYDGLERVISSTSGGRTHTYTYTGSNTVPDRVTDQDDQTTHFTYDVGLNNKLTSVTSADGIVQHFDYDTVSGLLRAATESGAGNSVNLAMAYNKNGQMLSKQFTSTSPNPARKTRLLSSVYSVTGVLLSHTDAGNNTQTYTYDDWGRVSSIRDAIMSARLFYDSQSRLYKWTTTSGDHSLDTVLTWDGLGRETNRTMVDHLADDDVTLSIDQTYNDNGLLTGRTTQRQKNLIRFETYNYDEIGRLTKYYCKGSEVPIDHRGNKIQIQIYTYDDLNNITKVSSQFVGGSADTATYFYTNPEDPCQLTSIGHTHHDYPTVELAYDSAGRLIRDEEGRSLEYDQLGRLTRVSNKAGSLSGRYEYDALNALFAQQQADGSRLEHYSMMNGLSSTIQFDQSGQASVCHRLQLNATLLAQRKDNADALLLGTDRHGSVLFTSTSDDQSAFVYTPYGFCSALSDATVPGFNGELLDEVSGGYNLGSGYRSYNPSLMRFNRPDSMSPFGRGGINAYAYCSGDPINRTDPTGHWSMGGSSFAARQPKPEAPASMWPAIAGIAMGIIGIGLATAAFAATGLSPMVIGAWVAGATAIGTGTASLILRKSNPRLSEVLGVVSLVSGGASLFMGGAAFKSAQAFLSDNDTSLIKEVKAQNSFKSSSNINTVNLNMKASGFGEVRMLGEAPSMSDLPVMSERHVMRMSEAMSDSQPEIADSFDADDRFRHFDRFLEEIRPVRRGNSLTAEEQEQLRQFTAQIDDAPEVLRLRAAHARGEDAMRLQLAEDREFWEQERRRVQEAQALGELPEDLTF